MEISERVVSGMERHAAAGKWFGGVYPYGYTLHDPTRKLVIVAEQAPVVREIYRLYTGQRLGTQAIARTLTARGLRTRTGGPWSARTVAGILTNRVYLGELTFRDVTVTGSHPPLVDEATFDQAGAIMDARGEDHTRRASNASDYHLTGRIRCPQCGKALIGTAAHGRNKTYRYYTCFSRARYGTDTCNAHRINADALDEAIFDALTGFYRHHHELIVDAIAEATTEHTTGLGDRQAELTTIEKELTRANTAIDRYLQAFEDGDLNPAILTDRMRKLSDKITQLTDRRDELADQLSQAPAVPPAMVLDELTDHIADIIRTGNPAQRKALIEALVAEVKITGPNTIIPIFRIPQPPATHATPENTKAAAAPPAATASGRMVRTMVEPVDLLRAYSKRCDLVFELVSALEGLRGAATSGADSGLSVCSESAPRVWRISDRLSEADISSLVAAYHGGTSARELAERYKIGQSSVKTLLRKRGVRRNAPAA